MLDPADAPDPERVPNVAPAASRFRRLDPTTPNLDFHL